MGKKPAEEAKFWEGIRKKDKEEAGRDGILVEFSQGFHQKNFFLKICFGD